MPAIMRVKVNRQGLRNSLTAFEQPDTLLQIGQLANSLMQPYIPIDTGRLRKSVQYMPYQSGGKIRIEYHTDYAKEVYEGEREDGSPIHFRAEGVKDHWDSVLQPDGEQRDTFVQGSKEIIKAAIKKNQKR